MNRLPEILQHAFGTFTFTVALVLSVLGLLCLIWGQKLYWVSVAIVGFLMSYLMLRGLKNWTDWQEFLLSGVMGIVAMLLSFLFKKFIIAITAFIVFGLLLTAFATEQVYFEEDSFLPLLLLFVTGSFAAFFSIYKSDTSIRLLSSVIGGLAVAIGIFKFSKWMPNHMVTFLIWIGVSLLGFLWQQSQVKVEVDSSEPTMED